MQLHMHDAISYPHPHPRALEAAHGEETRREEGTGGREGKGAGQRGEGRDGREGVGVGHAVGRGGFDSHRGVSLLVIIHLSNRSAITI